MSAETIRRHSIFSLTNPFLFSTRFSPICHQKRYERLGVSERSPTRTARLRAFKRDVHPHHARVKCEWASVCRQNHHLIITGLSSDSGLHFSPKSGGNPMISPDAPERTAITPNRGSRKREAKVLKEGLRKNLVAYTLAGAGIATLSPEAMAEIVYTPVYRGFCGFANI